MSSGIIFDLVPNVWREITVYTFGDAIHGYKYRNIHCVVGGGCGNDIQVKPDCYTVHCVPGINDVIQILDSHTPEGIYLPPTFAFYDPVLGTSLIWKAEVSC